VGGGGGGGVEKKRKQPAHRNPHATKGAEITKRGEKSHPNKATLPVRRRNVLMKRRNHETRVHGLGTKGSNRNAVIFEV